MTASSLDHPADSSPSAAYEHNPDRSGQHTICLLSLSGILDDPRIRRQGDAFYRAGWGVVAIGAEGGRSPPPPWPILTPQNASASANDSINDVVTSNTEPSHPRRRLMRVRKLLKQKLEPHPRLFKIVVAMWSVPQRVFWRAARALFLVSLRWRPERGPARYLAQPSLQRLLAVGHRVDADVYLANDWHTLPIAMELAREKRRLFAYDTHEYALHEYYYRVRWRFFMRPWVKSIEGKGLAQALVSSAVSSSIARDVAKDYGLPHPPLVIRNVPDLYQATFRPCTERITILFHGLLVGDRGLEACVESVRLWRPEYTFVMRGPIQAQFKRKLDEIISRCGIADRVSFLPSVAMTDLVRKASVFDIGIFTPPRSSKHNVYALPNKFFEYIHAGLALIISDMPDMAELVRQYDLGVIVGQATPSQIAASVNELTRERIDQYKRNSLRAAQELNWSVEGLRLVEAYEKALIGATDAAREQREAAAG